jgi:cytochrome c554/c'-like protein
MGIKQPAFVLALVATAVLSAGAAGRLPARAQAAPGEGYAWADACKSCHAAIYESWSHTKHARTINRLNAADQQKDCIGCHTTGPGGKIEKDGKFVNSNVQCESCHGAAAAHAADPTVRTGLVRRAKIEVCAACHSDKSPHYRGFYYDGMISLVHPVAK